MQETSSTSDKDPEKGVLSQEEATQDPKRCTCGHNPENNLVEFDGPNDPDNPKNLPKWRKWLITTTMGLMTFAVTFSSSIFSVAVEPVAEEFAISTTVASLGVALFLFV
jgi:DHA1 family multidrug resistance protein-like MFS transporter